PKSFLQMVSFEPPILMFSGSKGGKTEENIEAMGCFAVNLVDGSLARRTYECIRWQGAERIERSGFKLTPATAIEAPLVDDCRAHLECRLHGTREVGSGLVVFGEVVAASILEEIAALDPRDRYPALDQALFLEEGLYATVERARPADPEDLSAHTTRYVYLLTHARPELFNVQLVRDHVAHLKRLEDRGQLELCGPFPDHDGGMVILRGVSVEEAREIAEADPFISSGAETYELRKLEVSCRDNNHLGMG
ncbi:MAG: flavin reductase, partial [Thermoleophilia bacterium]|nr:flavin reductase [Thermoleophilia bacterium]